VNGPGPIAYCRERRAVASGAEWALIGHPIRVDPGRHDNSPGTRIDLAPLAQELLG